MSIRAEIHSLTGLRGVAALCVMLTHYRDWAFPAAAAAMPPVVTQMFDFSYYGMTLFFVLSGFVIAYNYSALDWKDRPYYSCLQFFVYRFARLYPLLLFFVLFVIWQHPTLFDAGMSNPGAPLRGEVLRQLTLMATSYPYLDEQGNFVRDGHFFVAWSISTEFVLYMSFAFMMIVGCGILRRSFSLGVLACYAVATLVVLWLWRLQNGSGLFAPMAADTYYQWLFDVSPYYRALEFFAGMLAYWVFAEAEKTKHGVIMQFLQRWGSGAGCLILLSTYAAAFFNVLHPSHFATKLWTALGALLILQASGQRNRINALLSSRPLVFVGEISYSLYLFHFVAPNLIARHYGWNMFDAEAMRTFVINMFFSLVVSLALAYGFYRLIEVPMRQFIRHMFRRLSRQEVGA